MCVDWANERREGGKLTPRQRRIDLDHAPQARFDSYA